MLSGVRRCLADVDNFFVLCSPVGDTQDMRKRVVLSHGFREEKNRGRFSYYARGPFSALQAGLR